MADRLLAPAVPDATLTTESAAAAPAGLAPGLDRQLLRSVTDDTYFRPGERDAWHHVLSWLQDAPEQALARTAGSEVSSLQLLSQMPAYRGQLVRVRGVVRRAERLQVPSDASDVQAPWRCWLQDAAGTAPIVIYCLDLPAGFPQGMELHEPATFVGVAYKRWPYQAESGLLIAPVLLAKRPVWTAQSPTPFQPPVTFRQVLWGAMAAAALSLLAVRMIYAGTLQRRRRARESELPDRLPLNLSDAVCKVHLATAADADEPRDPAGKSSSD